jgi:hypothetical protein
MRRGWVWVGRSVFSFGALSCSDDTTEVVTKDVCYSEMRWVGGKRGSEEMFPGRDCVGCHIDNDGPPLAIGGTIYPYVLGQGAPGLAAQTGTDCFGIEGIAVAIEDADGQILDLVTNRAGNFYVEGNPGDFAKPFTAVITWTNPTNDSPQETRMPVTRPMYGGCARCHDTAAAADPDYITEPTDANYVNGTARIGLPGHPAEADLTLLGCQRDPSGRNCERTLMQAMDAQP